MEEVSFYSYGFRLWARLFLPDDYKPGEKRAAIIECPGYRGGAVDHASLPAAFKNVDRVLALLLEAGYIVLVPHLRGMRYTEGRPGYGDFPQTRLNPFEEVEDLANCVTYLQLRPEVDINRIGAFGYSFGGALAPYLAAVDQRVRCCVGATGMGDGYQWLRSLRREWEFRAFKKRVEDDLRQQVLTGRPEFVDPLEIMVPDPANAEQGQSLYQAFSDDLRFTLDSAHYIMKFKPAEVADKITCPLLIMAAEDDALLPPDDFVKIYDRACGPKKLTVIPAMNHYHLYRPENIDQLAVPIRDWFREWLPAK